jgi:hypothetical protein
VTAFFNGATLAASNRVQLVIQPGQANVRVSSIIAHPAFAGRALDFLWLARRS